MRPIANNRLTGSGEAIALGYVILSLLTALAIISPLTPYVFDYTLIGVFIITSAIYCHTGYIRLIKLLWRKYNQIATR